MICEVSDMDRSVGFYRDVLGLSCEMTLPYWSSFQIGSNRLGLHPPFTGSASNVGGFILGIEVDDINALRGALEGAGCTCGAYHDTPGGVVMDFTDPDNNRLQAIQPGKKAAEL